MINKEELFILLNKREYAIIKEYNSHPTQLRYGRTFIGISDIENQHYCERKVHFKYNEEVNSQIKEIQSKPIDIQSLQEQQLIKDLEKSRYREDLGTQGHDSIITLGDGIDNAKVVSIFSGIGIIGQADRISINFKFNHLLVIERKFRAANAIPKDIYENNILVHKASPYPEHRTQARMYCYCLKYMLDPTPYKLIDIYYSIRYYLLEDSNKIFTEQDNPVKEFSYWYNNDEVQHSNRELNFAIGYWQMKRDSIPCSKKAFKKGLECEYKLFCNECGWKEQSINKNNNIGVY